MLRIKNPWIICLAASSFFFYQFLQVSSFNVLKPHLLTALNTDSTTLGLISSMYFLGNAIFLIPAGIMLDNFSTRVVILTAITGSILGICLFVYADSVWMASIGRFLTGMSGGSVCFLGTMRLATRWFPDNRLAFVTGVVMAYGMLGGMVAQTPFIILVNTFGWQQAMLLDLALGVFIGFLMFLLIQDYPAGMRQQQVAEAFDLTRFMVILREVLTNRQNWYCGLAMSLLNLPVIILGALWGIMYLTQVFNLGATHASIVCAALFLGMLFGSPISGYCADRFGKRRLIMLCGLAICSIGILLVLYNHELNFIQLWGLFFTIGFGASAQTIGYPMIAESNPSTSTSTAFSLAVIMVTLGAALIQPIVGWLIELQSVHQTTHDLPIYPPSAYYHGLSVLPICMIIAAIFMFKSRETYARPE